MGDFDFNAALNQLGGNNNNFKSQGMLLGPNG